MRKNAVDTAKLKVKGAAKHNNFYIYDLSECTGQKDIITITCPKHGNFKIEVKHHLDGTGCAKCGLETTHNATRMTQEEYINRVTEIHSGKLLFDKTIYVNCRGMVVITCPTHGDFETKANNLLQGHGCKKCSDINTGLKARKTQEEYIDGVTKIHKGKFIYDLVDYKGVKYKIKIICPIHGIFEQNAGAHLQGDGCPNCKESKGEVAVRLFLETNDIKYEQQKTFPTCKNKNILYFDFYLPKYNICIEYDGRQHFEAVEYFGGEERFELTKKLDSIKNNYCVENNINLLRIPYTKLKKIDKTLEDFLKLCSENKDQTWMFID